MIATSDLSQEPQIPLMFYIPCFSLPAIGRMSIHPSLPMLGFWSNRLARLCARKKESWSAVAQNRAEVTFSRHRTAIASRARFAPRIDYLVHALQPCNDAIGVWPGLTMYSALG